MAVDATPKFVLDSRDMRTTAKLTLETVEGTGLQFRAGSDDPSQPTVLLDSGPDAAGPSPVVALLYSLGGCGGMDVIGILRKMRQDVTGYEIEIVGERKEDHPRAVTAIEVVHRFRGRNLNPASIADAIRLSDTKYCSVHATLRARRTDHDPLRDRARGLASRMHERGTALHGPLVPAALVVLAVLAFLPALGIGFFRDDFGWVKGALEGTRDASWVLEPAKTDFRPIPKLSVLANLVVSGIDPRGYALFNVLVHAANVLLLWALALRLTRDRRAAFVAATLFAVGTGHYGEAVYWMSGRTGLLADLLVPGRTPRLRQVARRRPETRRSPRLCLLRARSLDQGERGHLAARAPRPRVDARESCARHSTAARAVRGAGGVLRRLRVLGVALGFGGGGGRLRARPAHDP